MKSFTPILWILLLLANVHSIAASQAKSDRYPDSLLNVLHQAKQDSVKARALFLLADYWSERDSTLAVKYATESFTYTADKSVLRGLAHFYLAGSYFNYDNKKSQQEYLTADRMLQRFKGKDIMQYRSRAWHNYGALEQRNDNSKAFVNILLTKAIPFAEAAEDGERVAWNFMDLGSVFMNYKDYEKAGYYYEKAITVLHKNQYSNKPVLAECYINQAKSYVLKEHADSADIPLKKAFKILTSTQDSSYLPLYYLVQGMFHTRMQLWREAMASLDKGLMLAKQQQRPYDVLSIQYERYEVYKRQGKLDMAKQALEEVYIGYKKYPLMQNGRTILFELAQTEAALGNYQSAFGKLTEYTQLSDIFFAEKTGREIADLEAKYQVAAHEKKLLQLQNRNQLQQLLLYFGTGLVVLLVIFLIYVYRQRKKREEQRLHTLQQQQEIQIARAQLEGEERERKRVARDLHDGLGGMLAGVKLNLSAVSHNQNGEPQKDLEKVIGQLDASVHELRRIARNMIPEVLLRSGLARALEDLCKWLDNDKMHVDYEFLNIPENIIHQEKVDIYRIVQELLANAVRHSGATDIFLQCSGRGQRFYITIEDNGKGMTVVGQHHEEGLGLANIRARVAYLQGKMELDTQAGRGTIINIEINVTGNE
ncbi:hypothetical protein GCM10023231_42680 [Olivibacter ginsenosidimutans]|uniref:histidine kinase n=1 Tax=Olivibacter ginsenosidimutans TaxID=1176537 RepID=A0ABP9CE63_9SPHI